MSDRYESIRMLGELVCTLLLAPLLLVAGLVWGAIYLVVRLGEIVIVAADHVRGWIEHRRSSQTRSM